MSRWGSLNAYACVLILIFIVSTRKRSIWCGLPHLSVVWWIRRLYWVCVVTTYNMSGRHGSSGNNRYVDVSQRSIWSQTAKYWIVGLKSSCGQRMYMCISMFCWLRQLWTEIPSSVSYKLIKQLQCQDSFSSSVINKLTQAIIILICMQELSSQNSDQHTNYYDWCYLWFSFISLG
jgi:hypothetical protein